jgi:hypothetical protein
MNGTLSFSFGNWPLQNKRTRRRNFRKMPVEVDVSRSLALLDDLDIR